MDIIATVQAVKHARKWVVEGNGPMIIEFVTYRYGGHSYAIDLVYCFSFHSIISSPQHV